MIEPSVIERNGSWLADTNRNPGLIAVIRRMRRYLPGDPDFGDPLSTAGVGGPSAAARGVDRLLPDREVATREVSLAGLQVWQALTERISGKRADSEATIVFTDLVGFSSWSLRAGDEATLKLLRRVSAAIEPPMLDRGGHIVKRMGDGLMAVFFTPDVAITAALAASAALEDVTVEGYTPRMRIGIHTGHPQRIGSDWLGVDVNIAARVQGIAGPGEIVCTQAVYEKTGVPEVVAAAIADAIDDPSTPFRVRVGADADLVLGVRSTMDDETFEATMRATLDLTW